MMMENNLFIDMLTIAIPVLVIGYWARHEPNDIWQTLIETHQSNLDDIEDQKNEELNS